MSYTWTPTPADIVPFVPTLIKDLTGAFTDTTTPSVTLVQNIIDDVCDEVALEGNPDDLLDQATDVPTQARLTTILSVASRCALFGAAAQIQVMYVNNNDKDTTKGASLAKSFTDLKSALRKAISEYNSGQTVGGVNDKGLILHSFPVQQNPTTLPGTIADPHGSGVTIPDPYWNVF